MEQFSVIVSSPPVPGAPAAMPSPEQVSAPRSPAPDGLRDCPGFRVDGPEGRIGVVRRVVPEAGPGRPSHLAVATGLFIIRTVRIPLADVAVVRPDLRRVVVRTAVERPSRSRHDLYRIVRRLLRSAR